MSMSSSDRNEGRWSLGLLASGPYRRSRRTRVEPATDTQTDLGNFGPVRIVWGMSPDQPNWTTHLTGSGVFFGQATSHNQSGLTEKDSRPPHRHNVPDLSNELP
jgi:hypothetical protein